jgi:hypothetical protein
MYVPYIKMNQSNTLDGAGKSTANSFDIHCNELTAEGNVLIKKNLTVLGTITGSQNLNNIVADTLQVNTSSTLNGSTSIANLTAGGSVLDSLVVNTTSQLKGAVVAENNLTVLGTLTASSFANTGDIIATDGNFITKRTTLGAGTFEGKLKVETATGNSFKRTRLESSVDSTGVDLAPQGSGVNKRIRLLADAITLTDSAADTEYSNQFTIYKPLKLYNDFNQSENIGNHSVDVGAGNISFSALAGTVSMSVGLGTATFDTTAGIVNVGASGAGILNLGVVGGTINMGTLGGALNIAAGAGAISMTTVLGIMTFNTGGGAMNFLTGAGLLSMTSTSGGISITAGVGAITINAGAGGLLYNVGVGGIACTVAAGGMAHTVLLGNIATTCTAGSISQTAPNGTITMSAGNGSVLISNGGAIYQTISSSAGTSFIQSYNAIMNDGTSSQIVFGKSAVTDRAAIIQFNYDSTFVTTLGFGFFNNNNLMTLSTAGVLSVPTLRVTSSSVVANLNASQLLGSTWAVPPIIGATTRNEGYFTKLGCTSDFNATGNVFNVSTNSGTMNFNTGGGIYNLLTGGGAMNFGLGGGVFSLTTGGGALSLATGIGALSLATGAGILSLATGVGGILMNVVAGGISMTVQAGGITMDVVAGQILIQNQAGKITLNAQIAGLELFAGTGNVDCASTLGAVNVYAEKGGVNCGDNSSKKCGRFVVATTAGDLNVNAFQTGEIILRTNNSSGGRQGNAQILLDTTPSINGNITFSSKNKIYFYARAGAGTAGTVGLQTDTVTNNYDLKLFATTPTARTALYLDNSGQLQYSPAPESLIMSGTSIVLNSSSAYDYAFTGSTLTSLYLPDTATLQDGSMYTFRNNSSADLNVYSFSTSFQGIIYSGGTSRFILQSGGWYMDVFVPYTTSWGLGLMTTPSKFLQTLATPSQTFLTSLCPSMVSGDYIQQLFGKAVSLNDSATFRFNAGVNSSSNTLSLGFSGNQHLIELDTAGEIIQTIGTSSSVFLSSFSPSASSGSTIQQLFGRSVSLNDSASIQYSTGSSSSSSTLQLGFASNRNLVSIDTAGGITQTLAGTLAVFNASYCSGVTTTVQQIFGKSPSTNLSSIIQYNATATPTLGFGFYNNTNLFKIDTSGTQFQTVSTSTSTAIKQDFQPSITSGNACSILFGKSIATNESCSIGYVHSASAPTFDIGFSNNTSVLSIQTNGDMTQTCTSTGPLFRTTLAPNMPNNSSIAMQFGKNLATNNMSVIEHYHATSPSGSHLDFGFYNNKSLIRLDTTGVLTQTVSGNSAQFLSSYCAQLSNNQSYQMQFGKSATANEAVIIQFNYVNSAANRTIGWGFNGSNNLMTLSTGGTLTVSGVITSSVTTGTAPLSIASTTVVPNLNVSQLLGSTWASPGAIGSTTPAAGSFTTLSTSSTFSAAAIDNTPIGSTTASTGAFTTLSSTGNSSSTSVGLVSIVNNSTTPNCSLSIFGPSQGSGNVHSIYIGRSAASNNSGVMTYGYNSTTTACFVQLAHYNDTGSSLKLFNSGNFSFTNAGSGVLSYTSSTSTFNFNLNNFTNVLALSSNSITTGTVTATKLVATAAPSSGEILSMSYSSGVSAGGDQFMSCYIPSLNSGAVCQFQFGKAATTAQAAIIQHNYNTANASNSIGFGFNGNNNIVLFPYAGGVRIGLASDSTQNEGAVHAIQVFSSGTNPPSATNAVLYGGADASITTDNVVGGGPTAVTGCGYIEASKSASVLPLRLNYRDRDAPVYVRSIYAYSGPATASISTQGVGNQNNFIGTHSKYLGNSGNGTLNVGLFGRSSSEFVTFYAFTTPVGSISWNSTLNVTQFNTTSDYRLKSDIQFAEPCLEKIDQVQVKTFLMGGAKERATGVIAHEIQQLFPQVVTGEKDGWNEKENRPTYQQVGYNQMVPYLIKAIQELSSKVKVLENALLDK